MVELAGSAADLAAAGCLVVGIGVDDAGKNAAMTEKLSLPFPLLADPGGERAIRAFGLWHEEESLAHSALVLLAPDGSEAFRYVGRDYADRPDTALLLAAARELGLPPRPAPAGMHARVQPAPSERAYKIERLVPYFRGVRSAALALRRRGAGDEAGQVAAMAERYLARLER